MHRNQGRIFAFSLFGLLANGGEGDFGAFEETFALNRKKNAMQRSVGDAGDVVLNVLVAEERGHGLAEGVGGLVCREAVVLLFHFLSFWHEGGELIGALPGLGAAIDRGELRGWRIGDG